MIASGFTLLFLAGLDPALELLHFVILVVVYAAATYADADDTDAAATDDSAFLHTATEATATGAADDAAQVIWSVNPLKRS
jgi:hypothetical protein